MFISSGRLKNFANLVLDLYLPSGESSIEVTVSPKVLAHASKFSSPSSLSLLLCKYRCMVYISAMELLIGVPVAKTMPFPPVISSRYWHFMYKSIALCELLFEIPETFDILVATKRFLKRWASSTKSLSTPISSNVTTSSFGVSSSF